MWKRKLQRTIQEKACFFGRQGRVHAKIEAAPRQDGVLVRFSTDFRKHNARGGTTC